MAGKPARMGGACGYIMRAFAKAPQVTSPSATTTRSSLYETRSLRRWTSHRSGSRPLSARPTRRFSAARSACSSRSTHSLPLSGDSSQEPARKKQRGRGSQRPEMSELMLAVPHFFPLRAFSRSLHPPGPASLCGCERSGLIRWEWWQPVIGGFRCRGAVGLVQWPCPLAVCAAQRIQPRHGHRSFPLTLWRSWVWNGLPHRNHPVGAWMSGSCRGAVRPLDNKLHHSSQRFTTRSPSLGMHPTLRASSSSSLTSVDGAEEKGYDSLPSLNESVAVHLCLPTAIGWKARLALGPSWCLRQVQVLVVPLADTAGLYWFP